MMLIAPGIWQKQMKSSLEEDNHPEFQDFSGTNFYDTVFIVVVCLF